MKAKYLIFAIAAIALIGGFIAFKPKTTDTQPKTVIAIVVVKNKKVVSGPTTINANQGDTVDIKITNDQAEELHLHGYDKKLELEANKQAELSVKANLTGSFEYELEHSSTTLGHLQVEPR